MSLPEPESLPGKRLPANPRQTQDGQLYHAQLPDDSWATMNRQDGRWHWRTLRGHGRGSGTWEELQRWLRG